MHPLLTRHLLLHRYPFFSVDSATWAKQSAVGQIHLPVYRAGKPDYTVPPDLLALTERSRRRTGVRHIDDGDELLCWRAWKNIYRTRLVSTSTRRDNMRAGVGYLVRLPERPRTQPWGHAALSGHRHLAPQSRHFAKYEIQHQLLSYFKLWAASRKDVRRALRNYLNQSVDV
jgi:hypothetical protein